MDPRMVFMDEPTSGLDSHIDAEKHDESDQKKRECITAQDVYATSAIGG